MKFKIISFFMVFLFLFSCQDDSAKNKAMQLKAINKNKAILAKIDDAWYFDIPETSEQVQQTTNDWTEFRLFIYELDQRPVGSITAFQKTAKNLSKTANDLNNNIPEQYNTIAIKSRIAVLTTKINSLNLYINLQSIPVKKVVENISQINVELYWLFEQMEEIIIRSEIPKEDGEPDLIMMNDPSRAVPGNDSSAVQGKASGKVKMINSPDLE